METRSELAADYNRLSCQVEDDIVECETVVEEKCEEETAGYTSQTKCSNWPREVCTVSKKPVTKFTPQTECKKVRTSMYFVFV